MKYSLLLLALSYLSNTAFALDKCGVYTLKGIVKSNKTGLQFVVNEKTQSEYVILVETLEQTKLAPYKDRTITAEVLLVKKFNGTIGETDKILSVSNRFPDPLTPGDTGLFLKKEEKCIK